MNDKNIHSNNDTFLADWMAGKINDEQLKSFVSEDDYHAYVKIKQAMNSFESPSIDVDTSFKKNIELRNKQKTKQTKVRSFIPNWAYSVAATFVLAFGIFQFFNAEINQNTTYGASLKIALNEGSTITLNVKSEVSYPKYQSQRLISLKGEAFFEVTKKGNFMVETPQGIIHVLGTKFNVISRANFFEVICYEGKVSVEHKGENTILTPGKAWRSIANTTKQWESKKAMPSWLQAESSFRSVPVSYVIKSIENQYNVTIKVNTINLDTLFTGSFRHDNLDTALRSVCLPLGLDIDTNENQTIVLSKR